MALCWCQCFLCRKGDEGVCDKNYDTHRIISLTKGWMAKHSSCCNPWTFLSRVHGLHMFLFGFSQIRLELWRHPVCVCQQAHTGQNDLIIPDHKIAARKVYSALDFMDSAITRDKTNLVLDNRPVILSWNARKHWISWFTDWLRIFVVLKTRINFQTMT